MCFDYSDRYDRTVGTGTDRLVFKFFCPYCQYEHVKGIIARKSGTDNAWKTKCAYCDVALIVNTKTGLVSFDPDEVPNPKVQRTMVTRPGYSSTDPGGSVNRLSGEFPEPEISRLCPHCGYPSHVSKEANPNDIYWLHIQDGKTGWLVPCPWKDCGRRFFVPGWNHHRAELPLFTKGIV